MNLNQYTENIRMGLDTLRSHKMRSFLTVLGVIIGVLTVIVIASILTGMRSSIISLVEQMGTHTVYAFHLTTGPQTGARDRKEWQRKPLTVEDAEAIRRESTVVEDVSYRGFAFTNPTVKYRDRSYEQTQLQGVSSNYAGVINIALDEGRFISPVDDRHRNRVAVLGVNVVDALFPNYDRVAGRVIEIDGNRFTVVGVLQKRKAAMFGLNPEDSMVYVPYRTFRSLYPKNDFLLIVARAREGQLAKALDQMESILRRQRGVRYNEESNFDLTTSERQIQQFDAITASVGLIAIAISGVGLLVGGIGVMNIMLVSVTERTREIGVRKAIGAKRRDITFQFLFEAMTLTTSGGLLGIIFAVGISSLLIWLIPSMPAEIPLWAVVAGFVVSISVGLIFGVWPAVKAARLDPIEALRHE
ncbi:MAG: ABC transporter permease [Acidobacteriota bacterium]|jgi:putative ABC transport system permease protein